jgi:hypothetical protein
LTKRVELANRLCAIYHPVKSYGAIQIFAVDFIVMKKLCSVLFLGFAVISASAEDVEKRRAEETGKKYKEYTTLEGRVYKDVTITKITDAGISISHADGLARLRFEHLTPEQRKNFGITQEGSEAIYAKEMKAQAAYEMEVAAKQKEQQKAKEELLAKQTVALLEAERLMAERAQNQQATTKIESTLEIPGLPHVRGSNNSVLYPTHRYSPSQRAIYHGGGYVYPGSYGGYYNPTNGGYYYPYAPSNHCTPTQRNSIFHFTIK